MIANYKLEQARELARKHPKLLPNIADGLETLVASHRARSAQERAAPAPSVQARGMHRRDARGDLIGLSPIAEDTFLELLDETRRVPYRVRRPITSPSSICNLRKDSEISSLAWR